MSNVKLKKKKGDGGYEQLYPQTLAKNVITGTGNADADILVLRQRITNIEYSKAPIVIEVEERYSDGNYQYYEATGTNAWHFQNTEANLKIVFNGTNRGGNIVIDATDDMGMTMNYTILAGLYDRKFVDSEIKPGKIYDLLYYNYQFYLTGSDEAGSISPTGYTNDNDYLDWVIDCEELTSEELNAKFLEAVKSKKKVKVFNFSFPTTPSINLGNGFLKFEYFENEQQTVKIEFVRDELGGALITGAIRHVELLGWDEDTEEYYEITSEETVFLNHQEWKFNGGYIRFTEKQITESVTGTMINKYLKTSDFSSDINPAVFKEIVLNVTIKATNGAAGSIETTYRQFILKRPETYDMYEYLNYLKTGRVEIMLSGSFTLYNFIFYRITNIGSLVTGNVTLSIKPVGYFY